MSDLIDPAVLTKKETPAVGPLKTVKGPAATPRTQDQNRMRAALTKRMIEHRARYPTLSDEDYAIILRYFEIDLTAPSVPAPFLRAAELAVLGGRDQMIAFIKARNAKAAKMSSKTEKTDKKALQTGDGKNKAGSPEKAKSPSL